MRGTPTTAVVPAGRRMLVDIRNRIVDGVFAPGSRMPTRVELERTYDTTPVTVQRVFNRLAEEGFIVARGRHGTFVAEAPPHLCSFGCVFPYRDRPERPWPQFWRALATEARKLQRPGVSLSFSYGNEYHEDLEAYARLVDDVVSRRTAGLLFASKPSYLRGSPVLVAEGIPRVAIMAKADIPGVKAVSVRGDWMPTAVQRLIEAGRRRVAVVTVPKLEAVVEAVLGASGLEVRRSWIQTIHPDACDSARNAVLLLLSGPAAQRPDGLVIADDNLVEPATQGIVDAGVSVPGDLTVVAHCNFPYPTRSLVPAIRLGYDVREVLSACMDNLIRQRHGGPVPDVTEIGLVSDAGDSRRGGGGGAV